MSISIGDIIHFNGDKLFEGAVDASWYYSDQRRSKAAAKAFVFHGPRYHGVHKGSSLAMQKTDTATFCRDTLNRVCRENSDPFVLVHSGYGTGKSHLILTLSELLHNPEESGEEVLTAVETADMELGQECRDMVEEQNKPSLVIPLNGMMQFNLASEILKSLVDVVKEDGYDIEPINEACPRFSNLANYLEKLNQDCINKACSRARKSSLADVLHSLRDLHDEKVFAAVISTLQEEGVPLNISKIESIKDIFEVITSSYCGIGKPYRNLVIFFDEFGKYFEFSVEKPYIAGSNSLQDLFEAVQQFKDKVIFTAFIQYELSVYLDRLANQQEAQRYKSRYGISNKVYLSTNLETLVANLIEKNNQRYINDYFSRTNFSILQTNITNFFPKSRNYEPWNDLEIFSRVICRGCWPLSPFALWFLFDLSYESVLQGRSAISLLKDIFASWERLPYQKDTVEIEATDLLTEDLLNELLAYEEGGHRGRIFSSLLDVLQQNGERIADNEQIVLKAIAIASTRKMISRDMQETLQGLSYLSGLSLDNILCSVTKLQNDLNLIEYDEGLHNFDIMLNTVSRTQFTSFIRHTLLNGYDIEKINRLFPRLVNKITAIFDNINSSFGEIHNIYTIEWKFSAKITIVENILNIINIELLEWKQRIDYKDPKGILIYCYVDYRHEINTIERNTLQNIENLLNQYKINNAPIFIIFIHDRERELANVIAEFNILQNLNTQEKAQFKNLVPNHEEKLRQRAKICIEQMLKERNWLTPLSGALPRTREGVANAIFEAVYPQAIPFPMDGFSSEHSNGPADALAFVRYLLNGTFSHDTFTALPPREKKRANALFKIAWGIFGPSGEVCKYPARNPIIKQLFSTWDEQCKGQGLTLARLFTTLTLPPYGMNSRAALLLLAVYIAGRIKNIYVKPSIKSQLTEIKEWSTPLLSKNIRKISETLFGEARLFILKNTDSNTDEWEQLLDQWESACLYSDLVKFNKKADELAERVPILPKYTKRFLQQRERSKYAQQKNDECNALLEKAASLEDTWQKTHNFEFLISCTANVQELLKEIDQEEGFWPPHISQFLKSKFPGMKQMLLDNINPWIEKQTPQSESPDALSNFKESMQKYINMFKQIGLEGEAQKLKEQTNKACRKADLISQYRQEINNIANWLSQGKAVLLNPQIANLAPREKQCQEYIQELQNQDKTFKIQGTEDLIKRLEAHQQEINTCIKEWKNRLGDILGLQINTYEDITNQLQELLTLANVFAHTVDIDDINNLMQTLQSLQRSWSSITGDFQQSNESIQKSLHELSVWLDHEIDEKDLPISVEDVLASLQDEIVHIRTTKSTQWITPLKNEYFSITSTSPAKIVMNLLDRLRSMPPYITDSDREEAQTICKNLQDILNKQKIEWLVAEFSKLSEEQKMIFIKKIMKLN